MAEPSRQSISIPIRRFLRGTPTTKRATRSVNKLRHYLQKRLKVKSNELKLSTEVNSFLMSNWQHLPSSISVTVVKKEKAVHVFLTGSEGKELSEKQPKKKKETTKEEKTRVEDEKEQEELEKKREEKRSLERVAEKSAIKKKG